MAGRLLELKKLIFISIVERALLEMKMRCVNPEGFPPKWLCVISMHGLGKRWPEAPHFNYDFGRVLRGEYEEARQTWQREAAVVSFPWKAVPGYQVVTTPKEKPA